MSKPEYWKKFLELSKKKAEKKGLDPDEIRSKAEELAGHFREKGYIPFTPSEIIKESDLLFACFYEEIGRDIFSDGRVPSPVEEHGDSSWMIQSDFCFLNIRATSPDHGRTGKISNALKLLPVIRTSSIHLAPFFDCTMDNLYAVDSLRIITEEIIDRDMSKAGIAPDEQMMLLIDAIHLLGKTVGFDLEPHTSQFSRIVMENPHHFRWLHFNKERKGLIDGLSHEELFSPKVQRKIVRQVTAIVDRILAAHGLVSVEDCSKGVDTIRKAHREILDTFIREGFWTLPSHTWSGVGIPEFNEYNFKDNYPDFTYLNAEGKDQHEHSFGMLTPFCLYTNMPFNREPEMDNPPEYKYETLGFLTGIFPTILRRYKFDFVRIDYVDHIFDSTVDESWDVPVSDRMTPKVLKAIIDEAKSVRPSIGAMAERMGPDIQDYRKVGFDLVLGQDVLTTMHIGYLQYGLKTQKKLESLAGDWETPASILFAVDTHDSGHPLFWTTPLSQVVGPSGLALRHFLSRFLYPGTLRRPKYEVMGNQDLSYGLYEANNKKQSLTWLNDQEYNKRYHILEDFYKELREQIEESSPGPVHGDNRFMFWFLDRYGDRPGRILCVAGLEKEVKKLKDLQVEKPRYETLRNLQIYIDENTPVRNPGVYQYDFLTGEKTEVGIDHTRRIVIEELEPQGIRLYLITERY